MVRTACFVCFISTVNGRSKKRKKISLLSVALRAGTQENLSSLPYLDFYGYNLGLASVGNSLETVGSYTSNS
jgi:hypothetical protein